MRLLPVANDGVYPSRLWAKAVLRIELCCYAFWLTIINRTSSRRIVGDGDVDVSLTTYGDRTRRVWRTVETIGRGSLLPRKLILWHEDERIVANPPAPLRRLIKRGLTLKHCSDYGPHKKYFPYILEERLTGPLVTADDDVYYPRNWLAGLVAVYNANTVVAYRAHKITHDPYILWPACDSDQPSNDILATGVSGVMYPPKVLKALRSRDDEFLQVCPRADDFWLHYAAVACGVPTRQVHTTPAAWWPIRPREKGLWIDNRTENDAVAKIVRNSWLGQDR